MTRIKTAARLYKPRRRVGTRLGLKFYNVTACPVTLSGGYENKHHFLVNSIADTDRLYNLSRDPIVNGLPARLDLPSASEPAQGDFLTRVSNTDALPACPFRAAIREHATHPSC